MHLPVTRKSIRRRRVGWGHATGVPFADPAGSAGSPHIDALGMRIAWISRAENDDRTYPDAQAGIAQRRGDGHRQGDTRQVELRHAVGRGGERLLVLACARLLLGRRAACTSYR